MAESWNITNREAKDIVEGTRRGTRDSVEHINKAFVRASETVAEKMGFPKASRERIADIEYWDKRISTASSHVKSLILRGQRPSRDETIGLLRDCAAVARALLNEFRHDSARSDQLEPLIAKIEEAVKAAEKSKKGSSHPVDLYYTLEAAIEANDERRLLLLPDQELRSAYLQASLDAVRKIGDLIGAEIHQGKWRSR